MTPYQTSGQSSPITVQLLDELLDKVPCDAHSITTRTRQQGSTLITISLTVLPAE